MSGPTRKPATYADVLNAPEHMVAEITNGELRLQPRPRNRHARSASRLGGVLLAPFDEGIGGPGGWVILDEPELHLEEDVLVPDLAGWRRENLPEIPDEAYFTVVPDWICEVLSPSTAAFDRATKLEIYAKHGVRHAWLIDPSLATLEVFALEGRRWILAQVSQGGARVHAPPFDAIELELSRLWAR